MKYCPFCGATLLGGAASFCMECGKPIPAAPQAQTTEPSDQREYVSLQANEDKAGEVFPGAEPQLMPVGVPPRNEKKDKRQKHEKTAKRERRRQKQPSRHDIRADLQDDGYDGYYNDVRPMDNGHEKERMEPELIKKIIVVAGGAVLVIILAIVMMLLL